MNELTKRILIGVPGIIFIIFCIIYSPYTFGALFLLVTVLALWEFYNLIENDEVKPMKYLGTIIGATVFIANFYFAQQMAQGEHIPLRFVLFIIPMVFLFFLVELFKKNTSPFTNISFSLSGIIYIAFPFAILNYVVMFPEEYTSNYYHPEILIYYFLMLFANDTGAYFAGKQFGKTKLFERISPKKTWEGSVGGLLLSLSVATGLSFIFTTIDIIDWLVLATIIVVFGTLGDLVESYFKRGLGIKDSGNILPGHGGVLDRFDSLLLSVPFAFVYLRTLI